MTSGFAISPPMLEMLSYPQYIQMTMHMLPPRLSTHDWPSGVNGTIGLYVQCVRPTMVTSAKARSIRIENTVLTHDTSVRPLRFSATNITTMMNCTMNLVTGSCSAGTNLDA